MMSFEFMLVAYCAISMIYLFLRFVEWFLDRREEKKYARKHFETTERFRNGL